MPHSDWSGMLTRPSVAVPQLWPFPRVPEEHDPAGLGVVDTGCCPRLRTCTAPLGARCHPRRSVSLQVETPKGG